jgi:signal transduction histidine kinase
MAHVGQFSAVRRVNQGTVGQQGWEGVAVTSEHGWRFDAAAAPPRLLPSVRARSAVVAVIVVAVALAGGAALLYYVLQHSLLSSLDSAATVRMHEVVTGIEANGLTGLDDKLKATTHQGQVVQVVGPNDELVASSDPRVEQNIYTGLRPAPGQVIREEAGLFKIVDGYRSFLAQTRGIRVGDSNYVVIVISFTQGQRESVETVLHLLLIGFPGLLLLVGLAIWLLIGRTLGPVERIRQQVARIGATRLDERVPIPQTRDEIARLAITMNRMLDRLQASQQAQRQFVADASHELRSPLATLSATLEVADADVSGRAWRDLRSMMVAETARMSTLVENLLLLARADDQGLQIIAVDVDLDDLLEQEARRLRMSSDLRVSTAIEPVRVQGDLLKLSQMLRNLVDNASRHARTTVRLSLVGAGPSAVLTVDDDGPGIPAAERRRVFERFVRLDESRDRASGGAGLGLPIVREVVLGHHGAVGVADSPDGGCRIIVQLPVLQEDSRAPDPIAHLPVSHAPPITSPDYSLDPDHSMAPDHSA